MKTALLDLFASKKFLAALAAIIVYVGGRFGFAIDPATLDRIFAALLVYVGAQGIADNGKSAAQIFNAASVAPTSSTEAESKGPPPVPVEIVAKVTPVVFLALMIGGCMLAGCGASARQQALTTAVATMTGIEAKLPEIDQSIQTPIATNSALTPEQRHEKLIAYRAKRDKVELAIDLAWRALGIAGPLNDDASIANVKLAVSQVISIVAALINGDTP